MRVVFAGTPEPALPSLRAIAASSHELVGVVTRPDAPAGRGRKLVASPVAQPLDQVPPAPHLQQYPREDADRYLKASAEHLTSYGVISEAQGMKTAHIPVDKAIDAVAAGKVAYRQKPTTATTTEGATK